ncbi:NAD(P)-binding protein [Gymnopus androsaceus JB14]|uniref:NAD(P)-binding protein n=1 Tax=Gymnopus androsaceus JB14 TaxID=1447944 RepID=A0A6A4HM27_9AGAR|nr:NAD(P)-binding protein [Gymnopus androsaceus JB14]
MAAIRDEDMTEFKERIKGKTVIITGGFKFEAKVVVADKNLPSAERTALEIRNAAQQAIECKCDVTVWDDLVAMYDLAIEKFGSVDIVVANAGVGEIRADVKNYSEHSVIKPPTTTIDVNLIGVLYTVHLAQHYLQVNRSEDKSSLKSVILLGSIASWYALSMAPMYTATKHAVLAKGIRINTIHPFFAATSIVPIHIRVQLAGLPLTPVPRIAGTIFYAASNPDPASSGASFWVPDGGASTFMIPREEFKPGVYDLIDRKSNATSVQRDDTSALETIGGYVRFGNVFGGVYIFVWVSVAVVVN